MCCSCFCCDDGAAAGSAVVTLEAYDILHVLGGLSNDEIAAVFAEWNQGELQVSSQHTQLPT
jgi:6-phosphogluconate dehydrogenase